MKKWSATEVRELRCRLGWSQAEFARHLGCRQQTISEWETGMYEPQNAYSRLLQHLESQSEFYVRRIKVDPLAEALLTEEKSSQITHSEVIRRLPKTI